MKFSIMGLVLGLVLVFPPAHAGQIYKWVDDQGKVHFADHPSKIPLDKRPQKKMSKAAAPTTNPGTGPGAFKYEIPKLTNEEVLKQLEATHNWDKIFLTPPPLPAYCPGSVIPFEKGMEKPPGAESECAKLTKIKTDYEKAKDERITEFQKWSIENKIKVK